MIFSKKGSILTIVLFFVHLKKGVSSYNRADFAFLWLSTEGVFVLEITCPKSGFPGTGLVKRKVLAVGVGDERDERDERKGAGGACAELVRLAGFGKRPAPAATGRFAGSARRFRGHDVSLASFPGRACGYCARVRGPVKWDACNPFAGLPLI